MVVGTHGSLKVYDLNKSDSVLRTFDNFFKGNIMAVGFQKDKLVFSGCEDGFVKMFDIRAKKEIKSFKHNNPINCAVLHPN